MSSLEYFEGKQSINDISSRPSWVSKKNKSQAAFDMILELKRQSEEFILSSQRETDFRKKSEWQIMGSRVARNIDAKPPSIMHNNTYSPHLRKFLTEINDELKSLKIKKIETIKNKKKRGINAKRKDELLHEMKNLKLRIKDVEQLNAKEQVQEVVLNLSLPVRVKLGWT